MDLAAEDSNFIFTVEIMIIALFVEYFLKCFLSLGKWMFQLIRSPAQDGNSRFAR